MKTEREKIEWEMLNKVCDLIHEHGQHLGEEEWRRIFDEALANSFANVVDVDDDEPTD